METTRLGKTGLKVSRICLGTMTYGSPNWRDWVLGEEDSRPFIKRALEAGINFFDTADVYSVGRSEEIVGKALKDFAARDGVRRHERRRQRSGLVSQAHHACDRQFAPPVADGLH